MENPYARRTATENPDSSQTPPSTPEEQLVADYEAAIGRNTGYYLPRFADFDAADRLGGLGPAHPSWDVPQGRHS